MKSEKHSFTFNCIPHISEMNLKKGLPPDSLMIPVQSLPMQQGLNIGKGDIPVRFIGLRYGPIRNPDQVSSSPVRYAVLNVRPVFETHRYMTGHVLIRLPLFKETECMASCMIPETPGSAGRCAAFGILFFAAPQADASAVFCGALLRLQERFCPVIQDS